MRKAREQNLAFTPSAADAAYTGVTSSACIPFLPRVDS
jgi:hypothetical protein